MKASLILLGLVICGALHTSSFGIEEPSPAADIDMKIARAEKLFEQGHAAESKQICEGLLQALPDRPSTQRGHTLNLMSKIYASEGDYGQAIDAATRSATEYEKIHDSDGQAHALNNKGIAELQTGTYAAAELDLQRALELSHKGKDLENQVQVLNNLGSAYFFRGAYSEATRAYDAAMVLVNNSASAKWSEYWHQITRFNQATLLQRLGRFEPALHIYREVEASSKALMGSDRAHLDANLGTLYRRLGDPYKALDSYVAAQKIYATQHDADGEIAVLKNSGIAYALDLEDLPRAASIFRSAMALAEKTHNRREEMQSHLYLGETLFRAGDPTARREFERALSLANELATTEEQWKAVYGLGRIEASEGKGNEAERDYRQAIALIEQSRSQLQLSVLRAEFFADKREAYDALIAILLQKGDSKQAFLFLEKSRARNFQDRVQKVQASQAAPLTLEQAQASLPPGVALLEFWTAGDQLGLIWCTRDRSGLTLNRFTPEQQSRIQDALRSIPDDLKQGSNGESSPLDSILADSSLPSGVEHLLIVPDGWTSYVPFDLLRTSHTRTDLIEQYDISYLPSAALLRRTGTPRHTDWPWARELAAFGDPVLARAEPSPDQASGATNVLAQPLPYASAEIQGIARLTRGISELFLRQDDLKKNFLSDANHAPLLHVSTHAFADGNSPENSRLLFSSAASDSAPDYLFLREIYDLDLSHVNLATISACDTERGKIVRGEGVQAFSRALLSAGADSSVTTLWRVDDRATAEFMKQFYFFLLRERQPKAQALRLAKLKFMRSNSSLKDPAIWAAFVLSGDGLSPVPRVISWVEIAMSAAVLALIFLFTLFAVRLRSGTRLHR